MCLSYRHCLSYSNHLMREIRYFLLCISSNQMFLTFKKRTKMWVAISLSKYASVNVWSNPGLIISTQPAWDKQLLSVPVQFEAFNTAAFFVANFPTNRRQCKVFNWLYASPPPSAPFRLASLTNYWSGRLLSLRFLILLSNVITSHPSPWKLSVVSLFVFLN